MFALLLLALALSMDAFAVALSLGAKQLRHSLRLSLCVALYFGCAQGLMPLIGYFASSTLLGTYLNYMPWIGCLLLCLVGGKMMLESFASESDINDRNGKDDKPASASGHKLLFALAIATSIDAMAAGLTFYSLPLSPYLASLLIGLVTMVVSFIGVSLGLRSANWLGSKAERCGGCVLILIGIKMLLQHS